MDLDGSCDEVRVKVYTQDMACVARFDLTGSYQAGWNRVPLPAAWDSGLANGTYFLELESSRRGQWRRAPAPLTTLILR